MFTEALFVIVKTWKEPKCPSTAEWINKLYVICPSNGILLSNKKGQTTKNAVMWTDLKILLWAEEALIQECMLCSFMYVTFSSRQDCSVPTERRWLTAWGAAGRMGVVAQARRELSWGESDVPCLDCGVGCMVIYACQKSSFTLKMSTSHCSSITPQHSRLNESSEIWFQTHHIDKNVKNWLCQVLVRMGERGMLQCHLWI